VIDTAGRAGADDVGQDVEEVLLGLAQVIDGTNSADDAVIATTMDGHGKPPDYSDVIQQPSP